jgi:two-component system response regulator TctD
VSTAASRVAVVRWPVVGELRAALRARRLPRLLLVRKGESPPDDVDVLEDWAVATAEASELEARLAALESRASVSASARPTIGDDDVVRFAGRWCAMGAVEARVARILFQHVGELVPRGDIEAAAWQGKAVRSNTTDRQVHRVRTHLKTLGLELHTIRGKGYVLELPEQQNR